VEDMNGTCHSCQCAGWPSAKIIVLELTFRGMRCAPALKAGAQAFVLKGSCEEKFSKPFRWCTAARKRIQPEVPRPSQRTSRGELTDREIEGWADWPMALQQTDCLYVSINERGRPLPVKKTFWPKWRVKTARMRSQLLYGGEILCRITGPCHARSGHPVQGTRGRRRILQSRP